MIRTSDAISALGTGNVLIQGGGAQEAKDKVVQHNGRGTVTIKNFTVVNAGKLYRSCGDCTNNGGPRNVVVDGLRANGLTSDLVGINSNYGDSKSCLLLSFADKDIKLITRRVTSGYHQQLLRQDQEGLPGVQGRHQGQRQQREG